MNSMAVRAAGRSKSSSSARARSAPLNDTCVGIAHENEILRRGIESCLGDDPLITVAFTVAGGSSPVDVDVVIASPRAAVEGGYACPIVIFVEDASPSASSEAAAAVLSWKSTTISQLIATVRAAAAGLRVEPTTARVVQTSNIPPRGIEVLRLLAHGASTRSISQELFYSERTVKAIIQDLVRELRAATRAQAVAEALRRGLI